MPAFHYISTWLQCAVCCPATAELSPRLWSLWPQIHAVALDFGVDYWEDLLIPLDNYVSKGTATFVNSTNPNYQESLYQMVEHTLSGELQGCLQQAGAPRQCTVHPCNAS